MTNRLLLHLFVFQDLDTGKLTTSADAHPTLALDVQLDGKVSLAAQSALAGASRAYSAELEASTHMLERLEAITRNATQGQFDNADPSLLESDSRGPYCPVCHNLPDRFGCDILNAVCREPE